MSVLGDARVGKLGDNLIGFARTLRRVGLSIDPERIILAQKCLLLVNIGNKEQVHSALAAVFIRHQGELPIFNELFEAFFKDPEIANKLLAQLLPQSQGKAQHRSQRARVAEALKPQKIQDINRPGSETKVQFDATMTAADEERLRQADFNQLSQAEFDWVEKLARHKRLELPMFQTRRSRLSWRGASPDWASYFRELSQLGDDALLSQMRDRVEKPVPIVLLLDISGSMERYARMMLTFLHAATRIYPQRSVFSFGTRLTPLTQAFRHHDPDLMLQEASRLIGDFAGGTRLGDALECLRKFYPRAFVGRRTLVLLVSDGLDTGPAEQLASQLGWLKRHCGQLLWFNPLMRYEGFTPSATGPALIHQLADHMLPVHNLNSLDELASQFALLCRRAHRSAHRALQPQPPGTDS